MPTSNEAIENMQSFRNKKSTRIGAMVIILAVIIILFLTGVLKKWLAIGLGIIVLAAIGIETFNYDIDLGKLWQTGNIQESRVSHTADGIKLLGSCAIPKNGDGDLNCSNFTTQASAQAKYEQCAGEIASYNDGIDTTKIKSLDIYRLDGDKDGVVCEALAGAILEVPVVEVETAASTSTVKRAPAPKKTQTPETETSGNFQTTPLLRTPNPYPVTDASDRSTPKALPGN